MLLRSSRSLLPRTYSSLLPSTCHASANRWRSMKPSASKDALGETSQKGAFIRTDATYRQWVKENSDFEPESARYVLYISWACPWANRCAALLYLKGLEDHIALRVTHPTWQRTRPDSDEHCGWAFRSPSDPPVANPAGFGSFPCDGCIADDINNAKFIRDLYDLTGVDPGKYTVPVLWDKKLKTIVNNESSEIIRMFNSAFNGIAKKPELDLYPEDLRATIDETNAWVYKAINNGVYRCGFARSQSVLSCKAGGAVFRRHYEEAFHELFDALDRVEDILAKNRYLMGDRFTEADVRLYMTLIRFDPVYTVYFKTNKKHIHEYPNMREYVKELYNMDALQQTTNIAHIKRHYYTSHPVLNAYAVIPLGGEEWWKGSHKRDETHPLK